MTGWLADGDTDDWSADLEAARRPTTPQQDAWDSGWRQRFDRFVDGGKSQGDAARIAWRLTQQQHGLRPTNTTEDT